VAITFKGSAATASFVGNNATTQNLFVLENLFTSNCHINVRRLMVQCDGIGILTAVMPLVKSCRITSATSGGTELPKTPFVTTQASDDGVVVRSGENTPIVATPAEPVVWEKFLTRAHTAAEMREGADASLLPSLVDTQTFKIRRGEKLLVWVAAAADTSNASTDMNWFVECVWEEDNLGTYTVSGVVTISAVPRNGAEVVVMVADDNAMTNAYLHSVQVTAGSGNWSAGIPTGKVAFAYAHDDVTGTLYTSPGRPFNV